MNLLALCLRTLFPDTCAGCGTVGDFLCFSCLRTLTPALQPMPSYVYSLFSYKDTRVRMLIRLFKYRRARRVASIFAHSLAACVAEYMSEEYLCSRVILVPIPLSVRSFKKRGYNQAEDLARGIIEKLPKGMAVIETSLIQKKNDTKPQAQVTAREDRLRNVQGCFAIQKLIQSTDPIILIDDVLTTGATLNEAKLLLESAGYKNIYALTVAH